MKFDELDVLVNNILTKKYGLSSERRDYRELEKKRPDMFGGYGKRNGLMYLVDVGPDLYVDINIHEREFKMVFRKDDYKLIRKIEDFNSPEKYLRYFLKLVDEYNDLNQIFKKFERGDKILERDINIESIIK